VWAWRKPGINSWLRAEPTLAENPKKRSKRGPKKGQKHPQTSLLAENPKNDQKRVRVTPPENDKKPQKSEKRPKNTKKRPYTISQGEVR